MKVLGLDIGTTSIGWAIIEEGQEIIKTGVHIFPVGVRDDKYLKSGTEESKNVARRSARMARRLLFRYKLRRAQLKKILLQNGMMPDMVEHKGKLLLTPFMGRDLYKLRFDALNQQISLQELGRILLHLNQRRGFKSSRKAGKKGGEDETGIKKIMGELDSKILESGSRTLGEFFYKLYLQADEIPNWHNPDEPAELIRNRSHKDQSRYVYRKTYENEFDLIWENQNTFYPNTLTEDLKNEIKNRTIFYQRPLKSAKHLVARCQFFPKKRVIPRSHPLFQEFRIWQMFGNLRITMPSDRTSVYRINDKLSLEEKHALAKLYAFDARPTKTKAIQALKLFGIGKEASFNKIEGFEKGNSTLAQFADALGEKRVSAMNAAQLDQLWHVLYCANENGELIHHLIDHYGYSQEEAENLAEIDLQPDYGSLSTKAIRGILAHMKEGMEYPEACLACGFHHSFDTEASDADRVLVEKLKRSKEDELRNPLVNKVVSETYKVVNSLMAEYGRPDTVRIEFARSLQKPKEARERELNQNREKEASRDAYREFLGNHPSTSQLKVGGSLISKFELWLEMEHSTDDLLRLAPDANLDDFNKFRQKVNRKDTVKYKLWLECGRISPYTGKVIGLAQLFSSEIEVEHILPYSISQDNSFTNLTLAERAFNVVKGNKTPMQYFHSRPEAEMLAFKKRASSFGEGKKRRLLFDGSDEEIENKFRPDALAATAYIAKVVRKKLATAIKNVETTNGQATSQLRDKWGMNGILNPGGDKKVRDDHRHHAVDALVIACTTKAHINKMSREATFDSKGRMRLENFPAPMERFYHLAEESINSILVSYRSGSRLLVSRKNKYTHAKDGKAQKTITVRGALHEETNYGQIIHPETGNPTYVVRKSIASVVKKLEDLNKIVDKPTRERIKLYLEEKGAITEKQIQESLANGFTYKSKDGKKTIPVYKVRIVNPAKSLIQIRPNENKKLFVASGNNHIFAIYEGSDGKRSFMNYSVFESIQCLKKSGEIVRNLDDFGRQLLVAFQSNEMFIRFDNHPDEIDWNNNQLLASRLYRIAKFDVKGSIYSTLHKASGVNVDYPKRYEPNVVLGKTFNSWRGIKVRLDSSGKITRL
jgi:CRISPR-associated endonuclease Csn1